jgi:hypothetical protein
MEGCRMDRGLVERTEGCRRNRWPYMGPRAIEGIEGPEGTEDCKGDRVSQRGQSATEGTDGRGSQRGDRAAEGTEAIKPQRTVEEKESRRGDKEP